MKRFFRERSRIITSVVTPLLWIMIFGSGVRGAMGSGQQVGGGGDYRAFIFPGILGMSLLFSAMWSGISVIWDRQFGFLKVVLASPVSRAGFVVGKAMGGATASMIQGLLLLCFAPIVGFKLTVAMVLEVVPVMFLIAVGLVCIGLFIAAFMESLEGFNMIMSFAIMPMFFFSGALYPLTNAPGWLRTASMFDPLTYGVSMLRSIMLPGAHATAIPAHAAFGFLAAFATTAVALSAVAFNRKK